MVRGDRVRCLTYNLESYRYRIREHGFAPLIECGIWLATPFCLNCYAGLIRKRLRQKDTKENMSATPP
ncbi:MAG: hypothetical protein RQM90_03335 [Methanoculleus sp.]